MICQLCKLEVHRVYKVVKKKEIFECENCQLGFIEQENINTILDRSTQDGASLYNFKEYKNQEKKLRKKFEKLAEIIFQNKKSGNVLDIGAGFGLFSSILQKAGKYNFDLIEPLSKTRFIDRSSLHFKSTFEKFEVKNKRYDVVVMMDVIEHFKDPLTNLMKVRLLLKDDGILVIQTPNYKSLMAKICRDWAWWMIEDHKFFFSPKSLKKILNKSGFKTEYFSTYEDWYDFKKNLDGNFMGIKNNILRKILKLIFFSLFVPFYFLLKKSIWKLNYGGLLFYIAKKS